MNSGEGSSNYYTNFQQDSSNSYPYFEQDSSNSYPNFEQDMSNYYPNFEQPPSNQYSNPGESSGGNQNFEQGSGSYFPTYDEGSTEHFLNNFDDYALFNLKEGEKVHQQFLKQIEDYRQFTLQPVDVAPVHGGSKPGRKEKPRNREEKHQELLRNYFVERPVYNDEDFRRRFRMKKPLFLRLVEECERENKYFQQKRDRAGRLGFTPLVKVTIALRMLAYPNLADALDEPFHIGESTACETLRQFCKTILKKYKKTYLREPNVEDIERLLAKAESRGFPGMIGSLDCMHWEWKNCPTEWQGAFSGRLKKPTIILEAVADADTWIWHAFFGVPGSQNDITVLGRSPLFDSMIKGTSPHVNYEVNNKNYFMTYYLADGIYPKWATLIQAIRNPIDPKEQFFTQMQESYRKDVERAFGILQARFAIIKMPGRGWNIEDLSDIMLTCIVLHNMIVEDERDEYGDEDSSDDETDPRRSRRARAKYYEQSKKKTTTTVELSTRSGEIDIESYMMRRGNVRNKELNSQLKKDLVEHLWATHGPFN